MQTLLKGERWIDTATQNSSFHFPTNNNNSGTLQGRFISQTTYPAILKHLAVYAHADLGAKRHISQDGHLHNPWSLKIIYLLM